MWHRIHNVIRMLVQLSWVFSREYDVICMDLWNLPLWLYDALMVLFDERGRGGWNVTQHHLFLMTVCWLDYHKSSPVIACVCVASIWKASQVMHCTCIPGVTTWWIYPVSTSDRFLACSKFAFPHPTPSESTPKPGGCPFYFIFWTLIYSQTLEYDASSNDPLILLYSFWG